MSEEESGELMNVLREPYPNLFLISNEELLYARKSWATCVSRASPGDKKLLFDLQNLPMHHLFEEYFFASESKVSHSPLFNIPNELTKRVILEQRSIASGRAAARASDTI